MVEPYLSPFICIYQRDHTRHLKRRNKKKIIYDSIRREEERGGGREYRCLLFCRLGVGKENLSVFV